MVDEAAARAAAEAALAGQEWVRRDDPDDEVVIWKVENHARAWVLHFATRRWLRTRDWQDVLVGACPFVVDKASGQLHLYGSAPAEYEKFVAWLDDERLGDGERR